MPRKLCGWDTECKALIATSRLPSVPFLKPTGVERPLDSADEAPRCAERPGSGIPRSLPAHPDLPRSAGMPSHSPPVLRGIAVHVDSPLHEHAEDEGGAFQAAMPATLAAVRGRRQRRLPSRVEGRPRMLGLVAQTQQSQRKSCALLFVVSLATSRRS